MKTVEVKSPATGIVSLRAVRFDLGDVDYINGKIVFAPGVEAQIKSKFPDKDVEKEILKAERWLLVNPPKKNYTRFLINWLNNAREKTYFFDKKPHEARIDRPIDAPEEINELAKLWRAN